MCICLPNGKFNFKFTRSHNCSGKKSGKGKHVLNRISESSEDDDEGDKLSSVLKSDVKMAASKKIQECGNGHMRQLSRDRQLPPVPDASNFCDLQIGSPRKGTSKNNSTHQSNPVTKKDQYLQKHQMDEYGSIYESESFAESKSAAQSPCSKQPNPFPIAYLADMVDVDPLYSSALPNGSKQNCQVPKIDVDRMTKEFSPEQISSDHLYSTIVKKDFSSLRKPTRPRSSIRNYSYQSLQSLHNQAPVLPVRLYKLSELSHIPNTNHLPANGVKLRRCSPADSKSSSTRRFSQPNSSICDNDNEPHISEEIQRDVDILSRIQSQYNTPPVNRASISDVRQLHFDMNEGSSQHQPSPEVESPFQGPSAVITPSENSDFYRHITVRESLASLRARNALPDNGNVETAVLPQVYEGLYETLYYSSADPARVVTVVSPNLVPYAVFNPPPDPLSYISQDNYLSITPLDHSSVPPLDNGTSRPSNDRSSVIYATTGSEVYAEISDAYLSRQYEELPDLRPVSREAGHTNSGYAGSPGTLRVLLEIQSFRHMDSDVDVCSRAATPLNPRPLAPLARAPDNNNVAMVRHPWFLPQRGAGAASDAFVVDEAVAKVPSKLAIMTPLMERSMEGSSMFLVDDNRNTEGDREGQVLEASGRGNGRRARRILYPGYSSGGDGRWPCL